MRLSRNTLIWVCEIAINNLLWIAIAHNQVAQTKQNIRFAAVSEVVDYAQKHGRVPPITAASFNGVIAKLTDAPKESESETYAHWLDSKKYKPSFLESEIKREAKARL